MRYLGRIAGSGLLMREGVTVGRTSYDFEGFVRQRGPILSSGEISLSPSDLKNIFSRPSIQLLTDDGRLLNLRLSDKELRHTSDVAQVEVSGDLPRTSAEWRGQSTTASTSAVQGQSPAPKSSRSKTAASKNSRRRPRPSA